MKSGRNSRTPVVLFGASGGFYLVRALIDLGSPTYYDPSTTLDYLAVVTTTLAMLALSAALASLAVTHILVGAARVLVWIPAGALAIGGLANLLEDAFGMSALGFAFGLGGALGLVGLGAVAVAGLIDRRNARVLAIVLLLLAVTFTLPAFGRMVAVPVLCFVLAAVLGRHVEVRT